MAKLSHLKFQRPPQTVDDLATQLITCAYQASENSSTATREAARKIAEDLKVTFFDWSIEPLLKEYRSLAEASIETKLNWKDHDIALQNIQARVRGPSIWMIANLKNALLLATSNRSEAAVGYATMDGDTCGGISPIGGIDKAYLRKWAKWLETDGPLGIRNFTSIANVTKIPPTAELRPQDKKQTDEDDLMPYEVLDQIERFAIRDHKSPVEVFEALKSVQTGYSDTKLKDWTTKFFRLWSRNQWKRERYAPAFHLDDESLDPKTWCRFPILSSGFAQELEDLERWT